MRGARPTVRFATPGRDVPARREFLSERPNVFHRAGKIEMHDGLFKIRPFLRRRLKKRGDLACRRSRLLVPLEQPLRIAHRAK
jgi:hypothetical protein